ncbi:TonB-dependent receptor [Sphingomonas lenta]|uniref:Uncharacterized protein n=1 Tax=Sphingomonas lenta TaxID=1141887 RepID=A0A2A2SJY3_9SPHN|nr:TonB-dependent receptor [Sphingomonas lenta]PAX09341.1 hypothetical protein CKY28_00870 [Sphingomonas lenta]
MGSVAALALGVAGLHPASGQAVEQTPPAPAADPSTTRSDEPAPTPGVPPAQDPATAPAADSLPRPVQTPAAPAAPGATAAAEGRLVYEPSFFAAFSPANALQIIERVPGFTLDEGDTEVRGFSQAAGNVVINGQRPSSKSDTLETVLQRIPATRVLRVEVGRGDLFGAEYAGRPQVANLVLSAEGGVAGTVEGTVSRDFTGRYFPTGSASALIRRGRSSFTGAVGVENRQTAEEGFDRIAETPSGRELEFRDKLNRFRAPNGYISGAWEHLGGEGRAMHLNARVSRNRQSLDQTSLVSFPTGPTRDDALLQRYVVHAQELGGDYSVPMAGGTIKLIGLATRRQREYQDFFFEGIGDPGFLGFDQLVEQERDETLVRVVWNRPNLNGWTVETGVEGVLNRLDSRTDLFQLGAGAPGGRARIDLPIDDAVVEEYRGEIFVNAGRPLSKNLRLDVGVTFEASELTVTGDAEASRVLTFLKPRATLDWRPGGKWHAQLSVKRTVAQLQFEDFISAAELASERVNGGNAQLQPQRAWEGLAFVERPILGDGLVRLELGYNRISLVQDRVPTPEGFDAPGNLGDGELFLARGRVDAPLKTLGVPGGRATLYLSYVDTSVRDPYTQEFRQFSGTSPFVFEASFRQDLKRFAWGFSLEGAEPSVFYRRDEEDLSRFDYPYVEIFAEYRPSPRTTITLGIDNLTNAAGYRERTFFFPDRRTREPSLFELRKRNEHLLPYVTLKHQFG